MSIDREGFNEAIANMSIASSNYFKDYVFYMHLIAQCRLRFDPSLPAPAAVSFEHNYYNLHINPIVYNPLPLQQRIGILKHEMLHLCLGHLFRYNKDETNFKKFNFATDCALNQEIPKDHLPKGAIYPDNFPNPKAKDHWNETAEFYYNLLEDTDCEDESGEGKPNNKGQPSKGQGDQEGEGGGQPGNSSSSGGVVDDHEMWKTSKGDTFIQEEVTKNMMEKAADNTTKSRGNLPSSYAEMLEGVSRRREVDWKKVIRNVVGNKKANARKTIMRRDRRMPHARWLKGRTKDRIFELGVVSDVSGSVSDSALKLLWGEIINICHTYNTPVNVVQVDSQPTPPEELTKNTKAIERKAHGGTYLSPAIEMFKEHNTNFDALVVTTDGYLCHSDIEPFRDLKMPVIWLIEPDGQIMDGMDDGLMKAIKLKRKADDT